MAEEMNAATLPTYAELDEELQKTQSTFQAAQVHGLVCGLLAGDPGTEPAWEQLVLGPKKSKTIHALLTTLYNYSKKELHEFSFDFKLFLPDDEENISKRAEALGLWCQGFLSGLKLANVPLQDRPAGEVTEAINDIVEIAQINYENAESDEENEAAYLELSEYVRLAAIMIFQDLRETRSASRSN